MPAFVPMQLITALSKLFPSTAVDKLYPYRISEDVFKECCMKLDKVEFGLVGHVTDVSNSRTSHFSTVKEGELAVQAAQMLAHSNKLDRVSQNTFATHLHLSNIES
jgi:hypothetical protein